MDKEQKSGNNSKLNEMDLTEGKIKTQCTEQKDKETNNARSKTRLLKDVEEEERQIIYEQLYKSLLSDDDDDDNNDHNNNILKNEVAEKQIVNEEICSGKEQQELLKATNKEAGKEKLEESKEKETDNVVLDKTEETKTSSPSSKKSKEACVTCKHVEKKGLLNRNNNVAEKNTGTEKLYDMPVKTKAEMCGKSIQMMCMKENADVFSFFLYTSIAMFTLPILTLFLVKNVIAPMCNIEKDISSGLSAIGVVIIIIMIYIIHTVKEEWQQEVKNNTKELSVKKVDEEHKHETQIKTSNKYVKENKEFQISKLDDITLKTKFTYTLNTQEVIQYFLSHSELKF